MPRQLLDQGRYDAVLKALTPQPPSPQRDLWLAEAHLGRREWRIALALLDPLPASPDAITLTARAWLQGSQPQKAIRLLASQPSNPGRDDLLAAAYRRDARYEDVLALATTAAPSIDLAYETAMACVQLSRAEEALKAFETLFTLRADHAAGWYACHAPALERDGPAAALACLQKATARRGANGKYWAMQAALLDVTGQSEAAQALFMDKVERFPARRPLWDGWQALKPALSPQWRLFGLSAPLLRHALAQASLAGSVLEFGVRRGTSLRVLASETQDEVHGFDSFEGLPESWGREAGGLLTTECQLPAMPAHVQLHAGWFEATLPPFLAQHPDLVVRLVNIDSDIYSSAAFVLSQLAPHLREGSILIFDEFIGNRTWREDEFRAFHEFIAASGLGSGTGWAWEIIAVGLYTKQVAIRLRACP